MCYRPKAEKVRYVHQPASWPKTVLLKENIMEEMESFTVRIEVNGKKELRTVERVEAGWVGSSQTDTEALPRGDAG